MNFNQHSQCTDVPLVPPMLPQKQKRSKETLHLSCSHCFFALICVPHTVCPQSALTMSVHSLLSVIFTSVPITSPNNKFDLLWEKSLRLVNTALDPCERQREYLQKEYMSIDRPSWPRLVSTIAAYWRAGIAFEGRQIDITVWCGSWRAGLPALMPDSLTLGQSSHLHRRSLVFVLRPLSEQRCRVLWERLEIFSEPAPSRKWTLITLTVDFYCKQVKAIDFLSAVTCKNWCDGALWAFVCQQLLSYRNVRTVSVYQPPSLSFLLYVTINVKAHPQGLQQSLCPVLLKD